MYLEGMKPLQIARMLGLSRKAVKERISRARPA